LNARYLHVYLQKNKDRVIVPLMKGAANVSLSIESISNIEIPLPSLHTQEGILSKIDGISNEHGDLIEEIDTQLNLFKKLRSVILQEAIEGKLTSEWRNKNPFLIKGENHASKLLEKIKAEKRRLIEEGKIKKEKPLRPITDAEKPFDLPQGWVWCRLGEFGVFGRGKSKHRPRNDVKLFQEGKYPFIQTGDIAQSKHYGFKISRAEKWYGDYGLAQSKLWPIGTLCITIAANIAETGFLDIDACFPDSIVGFTSLTNKNTSWYVKYYIDVSRQEIKKFAPATAQKNINLDIIWSLACPLPPLSEQQTIIERVNKLMAMIDDLENQVTERKKKSEMLMQSVLKEAFTQ
jgi:type I restriction enzyme, S subunit